MLNIKKYKGKLIAAELKDSRVQIITPFRFDIPKKQVDVYWENGPSWCTFYEKDIVPLYLYGRDYKDEDGYYDWDKIDIHFTLNYRKVYESDPFEVYKKNGFIAAWISPDGKFYDAPNQNHDALAKRLRIHAGYPPMDGFRSREDLIEKGWIIYGYNNFIIANEDDNMVITPEQIATLEKIAKAVGFDNVEEIGGLYYHLVKGKV